MNKIKLVAFDLDGTLLNSKREMSQVTRDALERAADAGIELAPCTGRYFNGMPESVRTLPFIHYAITINGSEVSDLRKNVSVAQESFELDRALALLRALDVYAVEGKLIYDCYMNNTGWIQREFQESAAALLPDIDPTILKMVNLLRKPVDGKLYDWLSARADQVGRENVRVQKIQCFLPDMTAKEKLLRELPVQFPDLVISTSTKFNIEINSKRAQKGIALAALANYLGIDISETMAFGDDINDTSLIKAAGVGVAMGNAKPEIKALAKRITLTNDEDGVAVVLNELASNK